MVLADALSLVGRWALPACLITSALVACGSPPEVEQATDPTWAPRAPEPAVVVDDCTFEPPRDEGLDPRRALSGRELARLERCVFAEPERAEALVDAFLAAVAAQGAPPHRDGLAYILHRGEAEGLAVSGSFDGWPSPGARAFRRVAGTNLHIAEIPVGARERHQYKLTRVRRGGDVEWLPDPHNAWVTWDGIDRRGPGALNNEVAGPEHRIDRSFIWRTTLADRDVYLQLPLAHFGGDATLGVLYVHDGREMLTRAGLQDVVDRAVADGSAEPLAVVYVDLARPSDRDADYTYEAPGARGRAYVDRLADEIVPGVERFLRTAPMPEARGLAGASLGGLISFYGAWTRSDVFRRVGAQSPSLWWNGEDMRRRVEREPVVPAVVYLDSGSVDDNTEVTAAMAAALAARGYAHRHVTEPGALHDWPFWGRRFDALLAFLY